MNKNEADGKQSLLANGLNRSQPKLNFDRCDNIYIAFKKRKNLSRKSGYGDTSSLL